MRLVFCNKYFFLNGGTERYLNNVMRRLAKAGHQVAPFSVAYAGSWPSPYTSCFLEPPGKPDQIYFSQLPKTIRTLPRLLGRAIYSFEARRKLSALLDRMGKADAAYLLNIYNFMSPSIIDTLAARGVRTVMRLGDYNLICGNYKMIRDGKFCDLCSRRAHYNAVRYRCVHGSLGASAVRAFSMYVHDRLHIYRPVHAFVTPSVFMAQRLLDAGMPAERIAVLPQPADVTLTSVRPDGPRRQKTRTIVAFGRISPEKGHDVLLRAFQMADLDAELVIVGRSYDGWREHLETLVRERFRKSIRFLDFLPLAPLSELVSTARLSVVPSVSPDNAPQAIVESYLNATPVLGADIGAIPELIEEGVTGMTFQAHSAEDLARKLRFLWENPQRLDTMSENALRYAHTRCSMETHLANLTALLQGATPRELGVQPERD